MTGFKRNDYYDFNSNFNLRIKDIKKLDLSKFWIKSQFENKIFNTFCLYINREREVM